jgi:hypothetical protein
MALKCSLGTCDTELDDNILVTAYVDRLNESYSGLYCKYAHMIADMIGDIFETEAFIEVLNEHLPDIANSLTPAQAEVIPAPVPDDIDILFAADSAETAEGAINLGTADNATINDQLSKLDSFVNSLLEWSGSKEYVLDVNRLPSSFVHNNTEYNSVLYSLFCEDPTFSITMTYSYDKITVAFSNPSYNFALVDLNDFFEHTQTAVEKLYDVIVGKVHSILGVAVNYEPAPDPEPQAEEPSGGPMLFAASANDDVDTF